MKIAHVVTYLSADHAFGGPLSVAVTQCRELSRRGHTVDLFCGWDGIGEVHADGVTLHRFTVARAVPGFGLRGIVAPGLNRRLLRGYYDVVHVHLARDLITLGAAMTALRRHLPYVVQPHGMVMPDRRLRATAMDRVATRRVLRAAGSVLALTPEEGTGLTAVAGAPLPVVQLGNGVAPSTTPSAAAGKGKPPDVLFLARLHPRKRVETFAAMAAVLVERGVAVHFSVVGPDEGDLAPLQEQVRRAGLQSALTYEGAIPYDEVPSRVARASVFVMPAVDEPFGMTILEALAVGTPVVVSNAIHLAELLGRYEAAIVTDGSPEAFADAVELLLRDPAAVARLQEGGRRALTHEFGIGAVVDGLEKSYGDASR